MLFFLMRFISPEPFKSALKNEYYLKINRVLFIKITNKS